MGGGGGGSGYRLPCKESEAELVLGGAQHRPIVHFCCRIGAVLARTPPVVVAVAVTIRSKGNLGVHSEQDLIWKGDNPRPSR